MQLLFAALVQAESNISTDYICESKFPRREKVSKSEKIFVHSSVSPLALTMFCSVYSSAFPVVQETKVTALGQVSAAVRSWAATLVLQKHLDARRKIICPHPVNPGENHVETMVATVRLLASAVTTVRFCRKCTDITTALYSTRTVQNQFSNWVKTGRGPRPVKKECSLAGLLAMHLDG